MPSKAHGPGGYEDYIELGVDDPDPLSYEEWSKLNPDPTSLIEIPNLVAALVNGLDIDDAEDLLDVLYSDNSRFRIELAQSLDDAIEALGEGPTDG